MAAVINIRGTGGSGKSYLIYRTIKKHGIQSKIMNDGKVVGYRLKGNIIIVGRYETDCGGCDQIKTQDEICKRVKRFARMKKVKAVLFEGLLISGLYSRYLKLSRKLRKEGHKYYWLFLDTPIEKCLQRTKRRRRARGNNKPLNPKNTENKFRAVELAKQHAQEDGEMVINLNHKHAYKKLQFVIRNGDY